MSFVWESVGCQIPESCECCCLPQGRGTFMAVMCQKCNVMSIAN